MNANDAREIATRIGKHTKRLAGKGRKESLALLVKAGIYSKSGCLSTFYRILDDHGKESSACSFQAASGQVSDATGRKSSRSSVKRIPKSGGQVSTSGKLRKR